MAAAFAEVLKPQPGDEARLAAMIGAALQPPPGAPPTSAAGRGWWLKLVAGTGGLVALVVASAGPWREVTVEPELGRVVASSEAPPQVASPVPREEPFVAQEATSAGAGESSESGSASAQGGRRGTAVREGNEGNEGTALERESRVAAVREGNEGTALGRESRVAAGREGNEGTALGRESRVAAGREGNEGTALERESRVAAGREGNEGTAGQELGRESQGAAGHEGNGGSGAPASGAVLGEDAGEGARGVGEAGGAGIEDDPDALLRAANRARRERSFGAADRLYDELVARFPGSRAARTSRVPHGRLLLETLGRPEAALACFSAYLAADPQGTLAEEALVGRAQALRRLGRTAEMQAAWRALLAQFPESMHAPTARGELAEAGP